MRSFVYNAVETNEKGMEMKREKWIDNAKGLAMLLVILGHVSSQLTGPWNFQFVYGIHLTVFFVLCGYTLKKKTIDRDFLNERFSRLIHISIPALL